MTDSNRDQGSGQMVDQSCPTPSTDSTNRRSLLRSVAGATAIGSTFGWVAPVSAQVSANDENAEDPIFEEYTKADAIQEFEEEFGSKETSIMLGLRNRFRRRVQRGHSDPSEAWVAFLNAVRDHPQLRDSQDHFLSIREERRELLGPVDGEVEEVRRSDPRDAVSTASVSSTATGVSITTSERNATSSIGGQTKTFANTSRREMGEYVLIPLIGSGSAKARLGGVYKHTASSGSRDLRFRYFRSGNTWQADTSFVVRYRNRSTGSVFKRIVERPNEATFGTQRDVTVFDQFNFTKGVTYDIGIEVRGAVSGIVNAFSDYALDSVGTPRRSVRVDEIAVL